LVAAFITSYFPEVGGAEVSLRQVTERLSPDFEFLIVTARNRAGRARHEPTSGGTLWRLGLGTPIDKWLLPALLAPVADRLARARAEGRRALLWGVDITQASLAAALFHRLDGRAPFLLTIQYGGGPERVARGRAGGIRWAFRTMLSTADAVTAISTPLVDLARRHGYRGPATVIPNGVDPTVFRPAIRDTRPPHPVVISVSRLVRKNGIDVLLEAAGAVLREHPEAEFRILGDGPERIRLTRLADSLGIRRSVHFLGNVPHSEIPGHLRESSLFVRPSRTEGMGNAFVEAMASGLPVVGAQAVAATGVFEDGVTGLACAVENPLDLASKIRALIVDPALADRLARQGEAWARQHYDLDSTCRRYADVMRQMLGC
jgi:glycosyltransferase involved in cell wall biosynthesis